MAKFWIEQLFQNAIVTQPTEYARICLERILNISCVLNIPGFWIWKGSEYASITQGSKYATIWLNMSEFSEYISCNTKCEVNLKVNEHSYWDIKYSELDERFKMERFGKIIIAFNYFCKNFHLKYLRGFYMFIRF